MDALARYGMETNPFHKNSKEILFKSAEYKEAFFRLDKFGSVLGFGLLTGGPGKGKTTTSRNWAASLNKSLYSVTYTSFSSLGVNDFYRNLASELGAEPAYRKSDNFHRIQDEVNRLYVEKKKTPVIIIDEADRINAAVLSDFKILFNFDMDSRDRAAVLLVGAPSLNTTLRYSTHEALRQRLVMNYNMEGLSKEEGRMYIQAKLDGAGCRQRVFDDGATEAILNAADGTPRMISKLCNAALEVANSQSLDTVTADAAMQAISDCELG